MIDSNEETKKSETKLKFFTVEYYIGRVDIDGPKNRYIKKNNHHLTNMMPKKKNPLALWG